MVWQLWFLLLTASRLLSLMDHSRFRHVCCDRHCLAVLYPLHCYPSIWFIGFGVLPWSGISCWYNPGSLFISHLHCRGSTMNTLWCSCLLHLWHPPFFKDTCLLALCWCFAGALLALCWLFAGAFLALCWRFSGALLALFWRFAGAFLALCWRFSGTLLSLFWRFAGTLSCSVHLRASSSPRYLCCLVNHPVLSSAFGQDVFPHPLHIIDSRRNAWPAQGTCKTWQVWFTTLGIYYDDQTGYVGWRSCQTPVLVILDW